MKDIDCKEKQPNRVLICALHSGSGKTLITCGLIQLLKDLNIKLRSYKCGPDYIDPMFHQKVLGIPSENIDSFFMTEEDIRNIIFKSCKEENAIIEGVMGIYDGLDGITVLGSSYNIASITGTPIVLIIDAHGMGRTLVPIIKGLLSDDKEGLIKGIILNKTSKAFGLKIGKLIEEETGVKVIGAIPKINNINIESRHLGLKTPGEIESLDGDIRAFADILKNCIDVNDFLEIMKSASCDYIYESKNISQHLTSINETNETNEESLSVKIAVAYDEAFCFYYEDNFRVLKENGIEIEFFSPLKDSILPQGISGILLGGGYPELHLERLEQNISIRKSIYDAVRNGIPILAECGGFMYLHDEISYNSQSYKMVGLVKGNCFFTGKLCRFGYVNIKKASSKDLLIGDDNIIKGHEFHYFDSTNNGDDMISIKTDGKTEWKAIHGGNNYLIGFPHLYYRSCPELIKNFSYKMREYKKKIES